MNQRATTTLYDPLRAAAIYEAVTRGEVFMTVAPAHGIGSARAHQIDRRVHRILCHPRFGPTPDQALRLSVYERRRDADFWLARLGAWVAELQANGCYDSPATLTVAQIEEFIARHANLTDFARAIYAAGLTAGRRLATARAPTASFSPEIP